MFDKDKLDSFFEDVKSTTNKNVSELNKHTKKVRFYKLFLPTIAAIIIGLLLIIPSLKEVADDFIFDITKPKFGELEKLHVENTVFHITDSDNKVSSFNTANIDEIFPGSKLIKFTDPEGIIAAKDEAWLNIKSKVGYFNQNTNILDLEDKTEVFFSEGMNLETDKVTFDFNKSMGYSDTPVNGEGSLGEVVSEGFEVFSKDKIIIFKGKTFIKINENSLKGNK